MGNFPDRLRKARKASGLGQEHLAEELGVSPTTYQNWEYGRTQPKAEQIVQLANLLGVGTEWLLVGVTIQEIEHGQGPLLPLLGTIACDFKGLTNEVLQQAPLVGVDPNWIQRGARYVVEAQGDSMVEAGIAEGDLVGLAPDDGTEGIDEKAIYALLVWNDQVCEGVILKYLIKEEDVLWAVPANGQLRPKPVSRLGDRVEVFGRVVGISKVV